MPPWAVAESCLEMLKDGPVQQKAGPLVPPWAVAEQCQARLKDGPAQRKAGPLVPPWAVAEPCRQMLKNEPAQQKAAPLHQGQGLTAVRQAFGQHQDAESWFSRNPRSMFAVEAR